MSWMPIADDIKARLTMADVFARYGFEPNRNGFLRCPFHDEKTASLSIYGEGKRWRCFGCGRGGDVISFVMELYGIGFKQAVVRLDEDFGLNLISAAVGRPAGVRNQRDILAERREKAHRKAVLLHEMNILCDLRRSLWQIQLNKPSGEGPELDNVIYALAAIPRLDYEIEEKMKEWKELG